MDSKHKENSLNSESNDSDESKNSQLGGIDFFPERRGDKISRSWFRTLFLGENRDKLQKIKCERNVHNVVIKSPLIKLMMAALKSHGCDFDLSRHICCEPCSQIVTGGYDSELNQVVICQNTATTESAVHGSLAHEMIHMFDYCRANIDFKDPDHLLCSEIRAANLIHCSFLSAMFMGAASLIRIKQQHQECVKKKALASLLAVKEMSEEEAKVVLDRVFDKCYNDLEPLGRRIKRNSKDIEKIYRERHHYGYGGS